MLSDGKRDGREPASRIRRSTMPSRSQRTLRIPERDFQVKTGQSLGTRRTRQLSTDLGTPAKRLSRVHRYRPKRQQIRKDLSCLSKDTRVTMNRSAR